MKLNIEDRIIKSELVDWRSFKFIQPDGFKELTDKGYKKLRESLIENDFIESYKVWEHKGELYCLDGYHRYKVLDILVSEGYDVPDKFRADFIRCDNRKQAAKFVLVYSSIYAKLYDESLYNFMELEGLSVDYEDIVKTIDLPDVDLDIFKEGWIEDNVQNDVPRKTLTERFIVPPFSILDARQGYWQDRKRAWIALGIKGELGREGGDLSRSRMDKRKFANISSSESLLEKSRGQTLGAIPPNEKDILKRSGKYGKK